MLDMFYNDPIWDHKVHKVLSLHNHKGFATLASGSGGFGGRVVAVAPLGRAVDLCVSSKPRRGGPKAKTAVDRDIQTRCSVGRGCGVFAVAIHIGAGHQCCGNLNQILDMLPTKAIKAVAILHDANIAIRFKNTKCLTENSETGSFRFVKAEVALYTTLPHEYGCIGGTKFMSKAIIMNFIPYRKANSYDFYHGHNGFHVHKIMVQILQYH